MAKPVVLRFVGDTKRLSKAFLKAGSEAQTFGGKIQKVGMGVALGVGAMAGTAALGLAKLGGDFQAAYANIRTTTGKTGDALKDLQSSFKNVLGQTPAGMADVSNAIAIINQQLGLTGKPLETFSLDMIRLGRLTKTDIKDNLKAVTAVLNNWAVPAAKASDTTNLLFRASQKSGIAVAELASQLASSGTQFRSLGLSLNDATSLLGLLGKQGLSVSDVMPALAKSMAKSAKEGKPAADAFKQTFSAIALAPNATKAAQIAVDNFGTRAGPKLAGMIREGKLSWQDFSDSITKGDTLAQAASDTATWKGKLALLKNQIAVTLEPLATRVFAGITDAMSKVMPYLKRFGDWFNKNKGTLKPYAVALGIVAGALVVVAAATAAWNAVLAINPITLIIVAIGALVVGIIYAYQHFEGFRNVLDAIGRFIRDKFVPVLKDIGNWILEHVWPAMKKVGSYIKEELWPAFKTLASFLGEAVVGAFRAVYYAFTDIWSGLKWAWDNIGSPIFGFIKRNVQELVSVVQVVASVMVNPFQAVVGAVRLLWNGLASIWNDTVGKFSFTVPNWVPVIGGNGFSVPKLPKLAEGGIVNRPTVALVGEAGPEAVVPLRNMGRTGNTYHLTVNALDPRSAATAVVDALKIYERNRGPIPVRTR